MTNMFFLLRLIFVFSQAVRANAAAVKSTNDAGTPESVKPSGRTDDVVLGHGVVLSVINNKFGLIFGPASAESDRERCFH